MYVHGGTHFVEDRPVVSCRPAQMIVLDKSSVRPVNDVVSWIDKL
jgi:hypothetical protein